MVNEENRVLTYSLTVCGINFFPEIEKTPLPFIITVNKTTLASIANVFQNPDKTHFFISGATANSYFYDEYYLGYPGRYQTFLAGWNDACPGFFASNIETNPYDLQFDLHSGKISNSGSEMMELRKDTKINTFAFFSSDFSLSENQNIDSIMVDRIFVTFFIIDQFMNFHRENI